MLDFNTKKNILQKLRKKRSENKLMWLPCAVAAAFVKLWYGAVCGIGMAFSDKNGNFLGIKRAERKSKSERKVRRQDDIVYVKKPFVGRVLSAVLAAAFVLMVAPELDLVDLGVKVSAADVDMGQTVTDEDGNVYYYNPDNKNRVFKKEDYDKAVGYTVNSITYVSGYNAIVIRWTLPDVDIDSMSGFVVELVDSAGKVLNTKAPMTSGERLGKFQDNITYTKNDIGTYTGNVRVVIRPITYINQWNYSAAEKDEDGTITKPATFDPLQSTEAYQYLCYGKSTQTAPTATIPLDARFNPPEITTPANKNSNRYETSVPLEWSPVTQIGGADAGAAADGYNIYRRRENGNFERIATGITGTSYTDDSLMNGYKYEYFVEAYRSAWDGPSYNPSNPGLITSNGATTLGTGMNDGNVTEIANTVYTNYRKNVYIAPAEPDLNVTSSPGKNTIDLTWGPTSGDYSGVILFRTTGEDSELDPDNPTLAAEIGADKRFSDWLLETAQNKQNKYGLERIAQLAKNQNTYDDKNIIEGETYWYYAVAYINTGDGRWLYGSAARNSSKLNLTVTRPIGLMAENGDGQVSLSWEAVAGAQGYEIEITKTAGYDSANETFPQVIYTNYDNYNKTTFLHNYLYNTDGYTYRVRAYINIQSVDENGELQNKKYSEWSQPTRISSVGLPMSIPQNVAADGSVDGQITVTWEGVQGASSYTVYYENLNNSSDKGKVDGLTNTRYVHTNLENGDRYSYYIVAHKTIKGDGSKGTQLVDSDPSGVAKAKVGTGLVTPQDLVVTTVDGQITVSWSAVPGAQGYLLYYKKNEESFNENNVFDLTKTSFNHTRLKNGDTYTYYVIAYKEVSGARDYSPKSIEVSTMVGAVLDAPKDFTAVNTDGSVNLSWSAVQGAEGYIVHASSGGRYYQFDVSRVTYTHSDLTNGDIWTYYVVAYKTVNGSRTYSNPSESRTITIGISLGSPKDFTAVNADGSVNLSWTAVQGAEGYIIHASSGGRYYQFDVSKVTYTHTDLNNGEVWSYYVTAYKTVNGTRTYSNPSETKTVTIGIALNSAVDLTATAGNRQIDLSWTAVNGADGYVVYLYNSKTMEFEPITVTSKTTYSHVGLKNGKQYTYMVAPYKNINGKRFYGDYSMSVTAIPTTGSITDMDHELQVKGTAPYGISHGEYITAVSNHGAFEESVDVYFTTSRESTQDVRDVLKNYADGLSSFIIYPFDISIYRENTHIEVDPEDGYTVTVTVPVPDRLIAYRDYITVVHIGDEVEESEEISLAEDWYNNYDQRLEILPCAIVDIDNVWCVQFKCSSFSPYAFVIYKEHIQDVASGGGLMDTGFSDTFNSGVLLFTALPDIMPNNRKLKVVQSGSKRYHIKSITKR